jgi:hypothetical protein
VLLAPPVLQDPRYHQFADQRTLLGVRNLLNVATNLPFAIIGTLGLWGLSGCGRKWRIGMQPASYLLFAAVFLVAFGSAFYHLEPSDATLFWDRLPMAVAFMSLLSTLVADRMSPRAGAVLFLPLACAGIASVVHWRLTDDLRFYLLVQFGSMLVILSIALLFPSGWIRNRDLAAILGWYLAAKVLELLDRWVYGLGGFVSGHSLKHLAAAMAAFWMLRTLTFWPPERRRT